MRPEVEVRIERALQEMYGAMNVMYDIDDGITVKDHRDNKAYKVTIKEIDLRMTNQLKAQDYKMKMVGRKYKHFKGGCYIVTDIVVHSETANLMVMYQSSSDRSLSWVRPLSMFMSKVDHFKYPEVTQEYRFELVEE